MVPFTVTLIGATPPDPTVSRWLRVRPPPPTERSEIWFDPASTANRRVPFSTSAPWLPSPAPVPVPVARNAPENASEPSGARSYTCTALPADWLVSTYTAPPPSAAEALGPWTNATAASATDAAALSTRILDRTRIRFLLSVVARSFEAGSRPVSAPAPPPVRSGGHRLTERSGGGIAGRLRISERVMNAARAPG